MPEKAEFRRQQIVASALDVLAAKGIVELTFSEVASRARVSAGLIVHYFGDKDSLLEAAFRSVVRRLNGLVSAKVRLADNPRARIEALIEAIWGIANLTKKQPGSGCLFGAKRFMRPGWRGYSVRISSGCFPTCVMTCGSWWTPAKFRARLRPLLR